jgi:hypothetical protein
MAEQCQSAYRCELLIVTEQVASSLLTQEPPLDTIMSLMNPARIFTSFINILILSCHLRLLLLNYLFTYFIHSLFNDVLSSSDYAA